MSRFDEELRHAAGQLAREPLPSDVLDEVLDERDERSRAGRARLALAGGVVAVAIAAMAIGVGMDRSAPASEDGTSVPPVAVESAGEAGCEISDAEAALDAYRVWLPCASPGSLDQVAVTRWASAGAPVDRIRATVQAVLDGPTADEAAAGLGSIVPTGDGLLASVDYSDDGLAVVSFDAALEHVDNLSTTARGGMFLRALSTSVLDLAEVTGVEFRVEDSCARFFAIFDSSCQHYVDPLPDLACPIVEPAELPSGAEPLAARPYPSQALVVWGANRDAVSESVEEGAPSPGGREIEVRGYDGWLREAGDLPLPEPYEITWAENGCAYSVYLTADEDAAHAYAEHLSRRSEVAESSPVTAEAEKDGVRLTVTLDRGQLVEGEVLLATTTVENESSFSRFWSSSGEGDCDWAVHVEVFPALPLERGRGWDGDLGILKRSLLGLWGVPIDQLPTPHHFVASRRLPELTVGCFPGFGASELVPGDARTDELAWRSEGPLGMPLPPGTYDVVARFNRVDGAFPHDPVPNPVSVRIPIEITGDATDYLDPGLAVDVVFADETFLRLLDVPQRDLWMNTSMGFEDGVWRIDVPIRQSGSYRLDYTIVAEVDAVTGELVDVRQER